MNLCLEVIWLFLSTNKLIQIAFVLCLLVVKYLTAKIQIPDIQSVNGFL